MALLGPPGGGGRHGGDRFSVGGFDPTLLGGDDDDSNIRYGRIPQRVPRRYKTKKRYELFHGNLVIDNEVPSKLLDMCPQKTEREFKFMRYTAATCDPNDFKSEGYTLRPAMYEPARKTELFIVMTMYNEDEELFCRTMSGVMKNIQHLITRERSKTWGKDGWKKVVVCIVSDGRSKINSRTLSVIAAMGAYQDGVAKNAVNGKPVTAHIYEYTSQIAVAPPAKIGPQKEHAPIQILFCLKEKNQKKINSHRWFFNAFGPILEPNVCVLLDVGTMPGPTSIYHLWKSFDINSNVGGACGEIVAMKGKWGSNLLNPLVAAQNFEYKMSNILDKPLESVFGYITVLPGAFSAYRYIALQNDAMGEGPLQKYFLGEKMHGAGADIFTANMYLAEDRILCWELVSKRGGQWILHYVKSAYAETDVPDQVPELISQRRRWLNGSFFAAIHSTVKFSYLYRSSHTAMRKFWIHVELVYQIFNLIFSWFALANFYIAFAILSSALEDPSFNIPAIKIVNIILNYIYLGLVVMSYLLSLGNRPQGSKWGYTVCFIGFGIITIYMTFTAFYLSFRTLNDIAVNATANGYLTLGDVFSNAIVRNIVISLLATLGLYIFASLLFFEPWHMITSFVQYLLMAPSYIAVLNVYAFANVHDVSWGTKGDNKPQNDLGDAKAGGKNKNEVEVVVPTEQKDINAAYEDALHVLSEKPPKVEQKRDAKTKEEDYYRNFRTNVLLAWTLSNALLGAIVVTTAAKAADTSAQDSVKGYMTFILVSVAGLAFVRFIGSSAYMLIRLFAGE
ncbi:glycosyltransferase family 2 protein [Serendipita vermifera MAFF 305830]|uniref:Chitin synthase n=1 Tax=Serendipita vermifera MAFF 305830 TaxID=933852 RepID=A0A0C3A967_SERVB|nr:glycosyltransferase family 2 protein [Serendipita vermifera MAFF 305830]